MGFFDAKNGRNMLPPEVAECDAKLMALAQQKQQMIFHIGELFVNTNNAESVAGTQYEEVWKALEQNAFETENTEKRKLAVQGLRKCDKCGFILSIDSVFCNKCGEKQSELVVQQESPQMEAAPNVCPDCGTPWVNGAAFCTNCGRRIG